MKKPVVLVVDDEPDLRDLVALTLTDEGFDVDVARDGREALEHIAQRTPDLMLLDMMMPVMDGRALCRVLQTKGQIPPIVVMTAADHVAQCARELGAVGWLAKPFDIDELVVAIRRGLEVASLAVREGSASP
jgi:DNA-binding response OmpR family regulator